MVSLVDIYILYFFRGGGLRAVLCRGGKQIYTGNSVRVKREGRKGIKHRQARTSAFSRRSFYRLRFCLNVAGLSLSLCVCVCLSLHRSLRQLVGSVLLLWVGPPIRPS